ncbi:MAG: anti-sigma factor domain-containing protein [Nitrospirota bacterium]
MKLKSILALLVAIVFTLGVVGLVFAADVKGKVAKIEGNKVTVKTADGKETTVEVKNPKDAKVGQDVEIKGNKVQKKAASGGY